MMDSGMDEAPDLDALNENFAAAVKAADSGKALEPHKERFAKIDSGEVEAFADELHPEFELHVETLLLEGDTYRGAKGIKQWRTDMSESLSEVSFEPQAVREVADDRYGVLGRLKATGRTSGLELDLPLVHVFELRDGKVWRESVYDDAAEGLAAIGVFD
jgi:ketosteroid isomerase-like protein